MRVLVLGGTIFLGRHIVETLLARGDDVTIFHRGERGRELFPRVRRVLGDRSNDLDRLPDIEWDAVVDTSGYLPHVVATSANLLKDRAEQYVFISSVSVYDITQPAIDESSPTPELPPGASRDEFAMENYGFLKLLCEREATAAFGAERTLNVRPGLIVGPHDPSDRFTYWPLRFARGGDIVVPNDPDAPIQWIDVRDLAEFVVGAIDRLRAGNVNTVGPEKTAIFGLVASGVAMRYATARPGSSLSRGYTSRANNVMPFTVSSWSRKPAWPMISK